MLFTAWRSTGFIQGDEHFQVLEFANARLGLSPVAALAPEYPAQARSFLLPAIAAMARRGLSGVGVSDPFLCAVFLRALAGLLYLCCAWRLARESVSWFASRTLWRWAVAGSLGLWFVPVVAARFSADSISGSLFFLALVTVSRLGDDEPCRDGELVLAGLALGLACVVRFQVAFLEIGAAAWLLRAGGIRGRTWAILTGACVMAVAAGIAVDRWGYGDWTFTAWNYFHYNIIAGVLRQSGVEPWWWYGPALLYKAGTPFGIALLAGFAALCARRPRSVLVWSAVPFVVFHVMMVHKEVRFLFPLLAAASYLLLLPLDSFVRADGAPADKPSRSLRSLRSLRWVRVVAVVVIAVDTAAFALRMWVPLQPRIDVQAAVYHSPLRTLVIVGDGGDPYGSFGLESYWYRPAGLTIVRAANLADAQRLAGAPGGALVATRYPVVVDTMTSACRVVHATVEARHPVLFAKAILEPLISPPDHEPWWWFVAECNRARPAATVGR